MFCLKALSSDGRTRRLRTREECSLLFQNLHHMAEHISCPRVSRLQLPVRCLCFCYSAKIERHSITSLSCWVVFTSRQCNLFFPWSFVYAYCCVCVRALVSVEVQGQLSGFHLFSCHAESRNWIRNMELGSKWLNPLRYLAGLSLNF